MFTRNFYKMMAREIFCYDTRAICKSYQNTNVEIYFQSTSIYADLETVMKGYASSINGSGIHLGSGTTQPTLDDYKLESKYNVSTISMSNSYSETIDDNGFSMTLIYTLTNNGTEALNINELGIMTQNCLVFRTVLAETLIIEPTGVGQIELTINFPFPVS